MSARGVVRHLLGAYLELPAADLRFDYGDMGQPLLAARGAAADLRFNLSHSGDLLLLAVARRRAVGVDLEPVRSLTHREAIERRVFSAGELLALDALREEQRLRAFYNGWTRKEAFAKATGEGMWATMQRVEVAVDPDEDARLLTLDGSREAAAGWTLFHLEPAPGFVGALAAEGRGIRLSTRCFESAATVR